MRQQAAWLLCFLAGIWLGVRAGGSPGAHDASAASESKSEATIATNARGGSADNARSSRRSGASTAAVASTKSDGKPEKPVKKTTLDDLRRLLALDLYECNLQRMFHEFEGFAKGLPAADLPAAAAMIWSSPHCMWSLTTLMNVLSRWAESDPKAPLDWLRTLKGDERIVQLMRQGLLQAIGPDHPDLLWEEIGPTQEWMNEQWIAGGGIARGFASDLKLAQKFLDSVTDPSVHYFALSGIADTLAKKDPAAAIAWARSQPRSEMSDQVIAGLHRQLSEKNPDAALAALNDSRAPLSARERERVIEGLAEYHPDRMDAFISSGGLKAASMREAELVGSRYSNRAATALLDLAPHIPAGEVRDSFLSSVASKLSERGNLDGAWRAVQDIQPSLERTIAMRSYGAARASQSIPDATTWLSSLPPGDDRDAAISGFAQSAAEKQPQMALEWASAVTDAVYRAAAVENHFETWHAKDARAAEAWLDKATSFSADEKTRLMEKVSEN